MQTHLPRRTASTEKLDGERMERRFSPPSDEQLLATYADTGSHLAFEELVHRYERGLRSYLRQYLGDAQLAEDAFQATFLQVHLKCRQFARDRRLQPWLYTIAAHQAVDLLRRNRRHKAMSRASVTGDGGDDERQSLTACWRPERTIRANGSTATRIVIGFARLCWESPPKSGRCSSWWSTKGSPIERPPTRWQSRLAPSRAA